MGVCCSPPRAQITALSIAQIGRFEWGDYAKKGNCRFPQQTDRYNARSFNRGGSYARSNSGSGIGGIGAVW